MQKTLLAFVVVGLLIIAACSKNNDVTPPTTTLENNLQVDLKQATAATNVMIDLHKNTANGHSLCFAQEKIYHNCDSLFSNHYYQYNQNIYSMHTGNYQVYQWSGNMMGYGNGMCGFDSIYYQNYQNTSHNYHHTDSLMYRKMMNYNMMQYMTQNVQTCYDQMQLMRNNHAAIHKLHY